MEARSTTHIQGNIPRGGDRRRLSSDLANGESDPVRRRQRRCLAPGVRRVAQAVEEAEDGGGWGA